MKFLAFESKAGHVLFQAICLAIQGYNMGSAFLPEPWKGVVAAFLAFVQLAAIATNHKLPVSINSVSFKQGSKLAVVVFALFFAGPMLHAQTPSQPSGEPFTVTGSFAASTSNTVKNGVESTFEYSIAPRWQLRIDEITDLNGNLINLGEGQFKIPINRIFKTAPPSFANILLGVHAGLGAVKAPSGSIAFGIGAGFSVDYQVNSFFFIRVVNLTDAYSRATMPANQVFGNFNNVNVGSGIGFTF